MDLLFDSWDPGGDGTIDFKELQKALKGAEELNNDIHTSLLAATKKKNLTAAEKLHLFSNSSALGRWRHARKVRKAKGPATISTTTTISATRQQRRARGGGTQAPRRA